MERRTERRSPVDREMKLELEGMVAATHLSQTHTGKFLPQ